MLDQYLFQLSRIAADKKLYFYALANKLQEFITRLDLSSLHSIILEKQIKIKNSSCTATLSLINIPIKQVQKAPTNSSRVLTFTSPRRIHQHPIIKKQFDQTKAQNNLSVESYINLKNQIISTSNQIVVNNDTNLLPSYRILNPNYNYCDYSQKTRIRYIINKKSRSKKNTPSNFIPNKKYCISSSDYNSTLHAQPQSSKKAVSSSITHRPLHNSNQLTSAKNFKNSRKQKQIMGNSSTSKNKNRRFMNMGQNKLKPYSLFTNSKITKLIQSDKNYDFDDGPPLSPEKENLPLIEILHSPN